MFGWQMLAMHVFASLSLSLTQYNHFCGKAKGPSIDSTICTLAGNKLTEAARNNDLLQPASCKL